MARRKFRKSPETPQAAPETVRAPEPAPAPDTALLARLSALEEAVKGEDLTPAAVHNRTVLKERARTTRPAGAGPAANCPYCGTVESSTGWRLMEARRTEWACTACADVAEPPYVNGSRRIPHERDVPSLLACARLGIPPLFWFAAFASRYGLRWQLATNPGAGPLGQKLAPGAGNGPWSHLADMPRWREVAALAEKRSQAGMGAFPPFDLATYFKGPAAVLRPTWDAAAGGPRLGHADVYDEAPDPNTPEQLAAEAAAVEGLLKAQRLKAKELEAAAAEKARKDDVRRHYRAHQRKLEQEIKRQRAALRQDLSAALGRGVQ